MTKQNYSNNGLEWTPIAEYWNEVIIANGVGFKKDFELYKSRSDQLAWSPFKPGHEPHLNPQDVKVSYVIDLDIGRMLSEMAQIELKNGAVSASLMVEDNKGLVARVLGDIGGLK